MNPIKTAIKIAIIFAAMVCVGWSMILFDSHRGPLKAQLLPYGSPLGVNASPNATGDVEPSPNLQVVNRDAHAIKSTLEAQDRWVARSLIER